MQDYKQIINLIHGQLTGAMKRIQQADFKRVLEQIQRAGRIFIHGAGRSGLAGRFFAMRLMHLGKTAFFVGDTITPAIRREDLLILISASGTTLSVVNTAIQARETGAAVISLVENITSPVENHLERLSAMMVMFTPPDTAHEPGRVNPCPLGTAFELGVLLFLESVIGGLILQEKITEGELRLRHSNLE